MKAGMIWFDIQVIRIPEVSLSSMYPVNTCISTLETYAPIITGNGTNI